MYQRCLLLHAMYKGGSKKVLHRLHVAELQWKVYIVWCTTMRAVYMLKVQQSGMTLWVYNHLVQEEPLALGSHKLLLLTNAGKVNIIMVWLCWPIGLGSNCLRNIQQKHGIN